MAKNQCHVLWGTYKADKNKGQQNKVDTSIIFSHIASQLYRTGNRHTHPRTRICVKVIISVILLLTLEDERLGCMVTISCLKLTNKEKVVPKQYILFWGYRYLVWHYQHSNVSHFVKVTLIMRSPFLVDFLLFSLFKVFQA